MKTSKVILFIVEGISDRDSLGLILSRLIRTKKIRFYVVGGDITSNKYTNIQNCINKVNECINKFLKDNKFIKSDILTVIHLVDTDGAYVSEKFIKEDKSEKLEYTPKYILTNNKLSIIDRNIRKSKVLNKLCSIKSIENINYSMYYFSCNLEHVLHNEQNLQDELKSKYADKFTDKYYGNEKEFIKFLSESEFTVLGDYRCTWDFIKQENNSLNRYSNFYLFLNDYCE